MKNETLNRDALLIALAIIFESNLANKNTTITTSNGSFSAVFKLKVKQAEGKISLLNLNNKITYTVNKTPLGLVAKQKSKLLFYEIKKANNSLTAFDYSRRELFTIGPNLINKKLELYDNFSTKKEIFSTVSV